MRSPVVPLLGAICSLVACADRPATAIVAAMASDSTVLARVTQVRLSAFRQDTPKFSVLLPASRLAAPGTLTFRDTSDGDSTAPLRLLLEGFDHEPTAASVPLIARSARLRFVREKSKLLRLGLGASCLDNLCDEKNGITCVNGECVSDEITSPADLEDASPGQLREIDLSDFDDLQGAAGRGGAGGQAGAGGDAGQSGSSGQAGQGGQGGQAGQGGEAGQGGQGGSPLCDSPLEATVAVTAPAVVVAGQPLTLQATVAGTPVGSLSYAFRVSSGGLAPETLAEQADSQLVTTAERCQGVLYTVEVTDTGCADRKAVATTAVTVAASGPHVSKDSCQPQPGGEQCGSVTRPWCEVSTGLAKVDPIVWEDPATQRTTLKVASAQTAYAGPIEMRDRVDVSGGWSQDFSAPSAARSVLAGPVQSPDPTASELCLLRWRTTAAAALVRFDLDPSPSAADPQLVSAALCVDASQPHDASLSDVRVQTTGDFSVFAGLLVHGAAQTGNQPRVSLDRSSLVAPSGSAVRSAHGLRVEPLAAPLLDVRGGKLAALGSAWPGSGGQAAVNGGLLWLASQALSTPVGSLTLHEDTDGGRPQLAGGPTLQGDTYGAHVSGFTPLSLQSVDASGDASKPTNQRAYGLWIEGNSATLVDSTFLGGTALDPPPSGQTVGSHAHGVHLVGTSAPGGSTLMMDTCSLVGGDHGEERHGLDAKDAQVTLSSVTAWGTRALTPSLCARARGALMYGDPASSLPSLTIHGGTFEGGSSCDMRFGLEFFDVSVSVDDAPGPATLRGSPPALPADPQFCSVAVGVSAHGQGYTLSLQGGSYEGGMACYDRIGVRSDSVAISMDKARAQGSTSQPGQGTSANHYAGGVVLFSNSLSPTTITGSTLIGGHAGDASNQSNDLLVDGLFLGTHVGAKVSGNTIYACRTDASPTPLCQGKVIATGVHIQQAVGSDMLDLIQLTQNTIEGGPVEQGSAVAESRGVLVRGFQDGLPSAGPLNVQLLDNTSISGNSVPGSVPLLAYGVDVRSGGAQIQSTQQPLQLIEGGHASTSSNGAAIGLSLCGPSGSVPLPDVPCLGNRVLHNDLRGGEGNVSRGVMVRTSTKAVIDANLIAAGGGGETLVVAGFESDWSADSMITNNVILGGEAKVSERACLLTSGTKADSGRMWFVQNLCHTLSSSAQVAVGLHVEVAPPAISSSLYSYHLFHNLLGLADGAASQEFVALKVVDPFYPSNASFLFDYNRVLLLPSGASFLKVGDLPPSDEQAFHETFPSASHSKMIQRKLVDPSTDWRKEKGDCSELTGMNLSSMNLPAPSFFYQDIDGDMRPTVASVGPDQCP